MLVSFYCVVNPPKKAKWEQFITINQNDDPNSEISCNVIYLTIQGDVLANDSIMLC